MSDNFTMALLAELGAGVVGLSVPWVCAVVWGSVGGPPVVDAGVDPAESQLSLHISPSQLQNLST